MNVFILCTGRNGSTTFSRACKHIVNFTCAHESRTRYLGSERFSYPTNHIEVDNRLSWMLGRLYEAYGDEAFYVHMTRDDNEVAESFTSRYDMAGGIIQAYRSAILTGTTPEASAMDVCLDYCHTVNTNIGMFLRDRPHKMVFPLEQATELFPEFWERIGADGDLSAAMVEWDIRYNVRKNLYIEPNKNNSYIRGRLGSIRRKLRQITNAFRQQLQDLQ